MTWQNSAITITTMLPIVGALGILLVPSEKDRANFCEFFELGDGPARRSSETEKARAAFEALFKK